MAIITSFKQQKDKNRVNVFLDGEFSFGIDLDNFVILGLKLNQELSEEEVNEIVKKAEFQKTLDKLLRFAMVRLRSKKEVKDWFRRKKVPEIIHEDLILKLTDFELLDDIKFAKWWVESRQEFSPKSKRVLNNELRIKGIDKNIIDNILSETEIDETKIAKEMLVKRESHWNFIDPKKKRQKMMEYLVRKGFDFSLAQKATKDYNTQEDDEVDGFE